MTTTVEGPAGASPADLDDGWGTWRPGRGLALLLTVGGAVGWLASLVLSVEKVRVLADPAYVPSCDLSPVVGCGSVMTSAQAEVLGFPNSFVGLTAFPVVVVVGVLALLGVRLPRGVWTGLSVGAAAGAAFTLWLGFQTLFRIGALCPYCVVVWSVTVPVFVATATWTLRQAWPASAVARGLQEWRALVVALWFAVLLALVLLRFSDYWLSLL